MLGTTLVEVAVYMIYDCSKFNLHIESFDLSVTNITTILVNHQIFHIICVSIDCG